MSAPSLTTWSFPTTVVFGVDAVTTVAARVKNLGVSRALVVCDAGVVKVGIADRVRSLLEGGGIGCGLSIVARWTPIPSRKTYSTAWPRTRCGTERDGVVAVGGGSPLDTGKPGHLLSK